MESLFARYPFLKPYLIPIVVGVVGIVFVTAGIIVSLHAQPQSQQSDFQNFQPQVEATHSAGFAASGQASAAKLLVKDIVIDVEGAVVKRGIYHLSSDSRVADVLEAAGGLSENADRDFVEKHINLAQKLVDGYKLYIPKIGETAAPAIDNSLDNGSDNSNSGTIDINTASIDQLDSLPGVGNVTAQKIINGRPYTDVQDLQTKKIVSSKVFGEIKDKVSTY